MDGKLRTAVLLAGGPAILDGALVAPFPRCFLPIANRPLLFYQGATLMSAGVEQLILVVGAEQGPMAQRLIGRVRDLPIEIRCYAQEETLGTAGSLKEIEHLLTDDRFLVMAADLFLDADLGDLADYHLASGAVATVVAARMEEPAWQMERIEMDARQLAKTVHRIHPAYSRRSKLRPLGLYLFERAVLQFIPKDGLYDIKEQLINSLYSHSLPTRVWTGGTYCRNILSAASYLAANADILHNEPVFRNLKPYLPPADMTVATPEKPPGGRTVPPVIIESSCLANEGAMVIGPASIGAGCSIGHSAVVNSSVLLEGCTVGAGAHVNGCVLGVGAVVPDGAAYRNVTVRLDGDGSPSAVHAMESMEMDAARLYPRCTVATSRMTANCRLAKRVLDIALSSLSLIAFAPIMVAIAAWIRFDSVGPVIFRQRRCAENGKEFTMYKFRTMVDNAEEAKREIQFLNEVDGPMFKITRDPRTTRAGRILRATNLDELPQLWNILLGDMSIIGPRPLSWDEMRFNPRWRDVRLSVPQGLIGLWQVQSHSKTSFADWIRYDLDYVRNWSGWLDLQIFFKALINMTVGQLKGLGSG